VVRSAPRLLIRGLLALVLLGGAAALPAGTAAAGTGPTPPAAAAAADYGAGWLARLITAAGGHVPTDPTKPTTSAPDASGTADAVLALHATGVGGAQADAALRWLQANYQGYVRVGGADVPGALAKLILVAHATGVDPRAFGAPPTNLVARLLATRRSTGPDAGLFGSQDPTYDGSYRQGLALLALAAVGRSNTAAVRWLKSQQCADGGWLGYRADTSVPCPAPDPATFSGPDTNGTSLAFQGLRAVGAAPAADPLTFFAAVQGDDGGWAYVGGRAAAADPNSTALVIQALLAAGEDPAAARWTRGGATPYAALLRFSLGCGAPAADRGAFWFDAGDGTRKPNVLATVQSVPAAAGAFFPLAPSAPSSDVPTVPCAAPTPSPSPSASPSPTASPSATPAVSSSPTPASSGVAGVSLAPDELPDTGAPSYLPVLTAAGTLLLLVGAGLLLMTRRPGRRAR
jgi:LPXTG-motif cell wall-anchored protein